MTVIWGTLSANRTPARLTPFNSTDLRGASWTALITVRFVAVLKEHWRDRCMWLLCIHITGAGSCVKLRAKLSTSRPFNHRGYRSKLCWKGEMRQRGEKAHKDSMLLKCIIWDWYIWTRGDNEVDSIGDPKFTPLGVCLFVLIKHRLVACFLNI